METPEPTTAPQSHRIAVPLQVIEPKPDLLAGAQMEASILSSQISTIRI